MTRARAIELLKRVQFCCDLDDCTNAWDCEECDDALNMAIEALEKQPKWIPVSERLPKRDELVLVTYKTSYKIDLCKYLDDGSENPWWSYMEGCVWNDDIIAWQPLPEPYRMESDTE